MAKGNKKRSPRHNSDQPSAKPAPAEPIAPPHRSWRERPRWQWILALFVLLTVCSTAAAWLDWYVAVPENRVATYVGSDSCLACHQGQHRAWSGSHHDLAMDLATPETVLGDFSGVELEHYGFTSRMYRDGDRYMIRTDGPEGELADYEVKYVFGFEPLQNYMVELERPEDAEPGEIGRVQVLRETWDAEKGAWYYLTPPDVDERLEPGDSLHWCGQAQNWNRACASCHSTNLQKNHQIVSTSEGSALGEYHTTFSEIDVSCEACHGPGSIHVELAEAPSLFWDRKRGYGISSLHHLSPKAEVDNCGQCHSRRRQLTEDFRPGDDFNDHFLESVITPGLYWCDGQIRDEVYVYGSFLQSKMYAEGIRCADCHNPHTTELRHEGNALCTSCHQHPQQDYDVPAHHHHRSGTAGASCVECHMPSTTYMAIDERRDHSLRVPRPDHSVDLGTPNACSRCHLKEQAAYAVRQEELPEYQDWLVAAEAGDQAAAATLAELDAWSLEHFTEWYGEKEDRRTHFAHAFHQAWDLDTDGIEPLLATIGDPEQPAIVRASAVEALGPFVSSVIDYRRPRFARARQTLLAALKDPDPRVRAAAVPLLPALEGGEALARAREMLSDPALIVRLAAINIVIAQRGGNLDRNDRSAYQNALTEMQLALQLDSDQSASHGAMAEMLRNSDELPEMIEREYVLAVALSPNLPGPRAQYAQYLSNRAMNLEGTGHPEDAARLRAQVASLREEERAIYAKLVEQLPNSGEMQYRYASMLLLEKNYETAEIHLQRARELDPNWPEPLYLLTILYENQQRWEELVPLARELAERWPQDLRFISTVLRLQQRGMAGDIELQLPNPE